MGLVNTSKFRANSQDNLNITQLLEADVWWLQSNTVVILSCGRLPKSWHPDRSAPKGGPIGTAHTAGGRLYLAAGYWGSHAAGRSEWAHLREAVQHAGILRSTPPCLSTRGAMLVVSCAAVSPGRYAGLWHQMCPLETPQGWQRWGLHWLTLISYNITG